MSMQTTLGTSFLTSLVELRQQKGAVSLEDVGEIFERLAASMEQSGTSAVDTFLRDEIQKMAMHIDFAKQEIASIEAGDHRAAASIGDASLHLDEVIKATEKASNSIMDAADQIQAAAAGVGGEKEKQIIDASMKIYEACNFQDLTGQRITKVIALLEHLEGKITNLAKLFGDHQDLSAASEEAKAKARTSKRADGNLLDGPQHGSKAPAQADIDALFNDLGSAASSS